MQRLCQWGTGARTAESFLSVLRPRLGIVLHVAEILDFRACNLDNGNLSVGLRIVHARHIRRNRSRRAMNILIWLIMGGIIGWLASVIMRTQEGILLNIVVGIVGALVGGWLISPLGGAATINQGDLRGGGLGVSLLGAIILLAIVNVFRTGGRRL